MSSSSMRREDGLGPVALQYNTQAIFHPPGEFPPTYFFTRYKFPSVRMSRSEPMTAYEARECSARSFLARMLKVLPGLTTMPRPFSSWR